MRNVFNFFGELLLSVVVALVIVLPVRYFLVQPFFVKGESMEPNFTDSEYLLIDEVSYRLGKPQRGEVIVFHYPRDPSQYYIKRIIGLPGEHLVGKDNKVTVYSPTNSNGLAIDESSYLPHAGSLGNFNVTLANNEFFVLGDNRDRSYDSRSWGKLTSNYIIGKVWLVVWPFPKAQAFTNPVYE